jgi:hypothetical protein
MSPEVEHSGHMFRKDVVKFGQRVDVRIAPIQEVFPCIFNHLKEKFHTLYFPKPEHLKLNQLNV